MLTLARTREPAGELRAIATRSAWFAGLPAALRDQLLRYAQIKSFRRGSWIYVQGDPPRGLWAVIEGEVSFSKIGPGGHEIILHVAGPGFWFGVFGVISGLSLNVAVTTVSDTTMLFVPRKAVNLIVDHQPRYALDLLRLTFRRALELFDLVEQVTRPSPRSRVASRLLLLLLQTASEHSPESPAPTLRLSQSQVAGMTALSRQSVSRALGELHTAGAIELGFRQIRIADAGKLQQFAETLD